jgi:hypothetical protein
MSSRGPCLEKSAYRGRQRKVGMGSRECIAGSLFTEKDKEKAGMGVYLCMGPFILALNSFYGLTSNFSCLITYFEAIFLLTTIYLHS